MVTFTCTTCGGPFAPTGGKSVLCSSCSDAADVVIRTMVAEGRTTAAMAKVVKLSEASVSQRRKKLKSGVQPRPASVGRVIRPKPAPDAAPPQDHESHKPVLFTLPGVTDLPAAHRLPGSPPECQWPMTAGRPWRFCCQPTIPSRSYCAEHFARGITKTPKVADAA